MLEFGPVAWPPALIKTERLMLRGPEARDRSAMIELFTSPEVGTYIGGPRPRDECERALAEVPAWRPGLFGVDLGGAMIGFITLLDRRDAGVRVTSARRPGRPSSATCSCRRRGDTGMPTRLAQRHSPGSTARFPASRWCFAPSSPMTVRCAPRRSPRRRDAAYLRMRRPPG